MSANVWPTVQSIPVSAVTDDRPPGHLRPPRLDEVAGTVGTGRDTAGGAAGGTAAGGAGRKGPATGVGTAGAKSRGASQNPAAELGFSGDPGQHGVPGDNMLHAQRTWDGALATNRMDDLGVNAERLRMETRDVTASVGLVVDGWPDDVRACVQSLMDHTGATVLALDLGNVTGAGDVLDDLAERYPERIRAWHVAETPHWRGGTATWGASHAKLLHLDTAEVHVLMDTSLVLDGDALTPLVAAVKDGAVAAGRQGWEPTTDPSHTPTDLSSTDLSDQMRGTQATAGGMGGARSQAAGEPVAGQAVPAPGGRSVQGAAAAERHHPQHHQAPPGWRQGGPGRVRALGGGLVAVRRAAAVGVFPEDARYGRYADLVLSLALRGELVVPEQHLPVRQRDEHDVPAPYATEEGRRNYDRVLHMLQPS